jgi:hypothetical protein
MIRIRYMLVDHDASNDGNLHIADGKFQNVPMIHHMCPVHHWSRLDSATIFVKASYPDRHHKKLMSMAGVTVLPATFSRASALDAIVTKGNMQHQTALAECGCILTSTTTTADIVDWAANTLGSVLDHAT